jgi:histidyl-tRNA synthetase
MYTLRTKGGGHLALRPEGTAATLRSYIEYGMHTLPQPVMLWYKGSFFRHEKSQKGRYREFQQFGIEILGEDKSIADALIIKIMVLILEELGLGSVVVHINSLGDKNCRSDYRKDLIAYYKKKTNELCFDCKERLKKNPLRLLDCKNERCMETGKDAPNMIDYLCVPCKNHLKETLEFLDSNNIEYLLDTHLVRGLDYYSRTVFEIFIEDPDVDNEAEEKDNSEGENSDKEKNRTALSSLAIASGGRYDYLAKMLSGKDIPATGAAFGVDRVVQLMKERKISVKHDRKPKIFFIRLGSAATHKSLAVVEQLRKAHLPIRYSIGKDSLKGQLKIASKLKIPYALILGQKEALEDSIIVRNMETRAQKIVPIEKVVDIIKNKLK